MEIYVAFLSAECESETLPDLLEIPASSKEEARRGAVKMLGIYDMKATLSTTSEEVFCTDNDGNEFVYYGFVEE